MTDKTDDIDQLLAEMAGATNGLSSGQGSGLGSGQGSGLGSGQGSGPGADMTPSDALMARIMADAATEMPRRVGVASVSDASGSRGIGAMILAALGGWAAVSGLAAATVTGLWLGISPPAALDTFLSGSSLSVSLSDEFPGFEVEG